MLTMRPMTNTGSAIARLGPMRVRISLPMLRPSSPLPNSNTNMAAECLKKIVSVNCAVPSALAFSIKGLL